MKSRNYTIDFLKFVFSVVIVIFHAKNIILPGENWIFTGGSIGVDFFFIVSGYFMAGSALKKKYDPQESLGRDTFNFMKRKISGLLPNVYVGWFVGFAVYHIFRDTTIRGVIKDAVYSLGELLFLTETGFKEYQANRVGWYLSAMLIVMFIIYPIIRKYKDTFFYIVGPLLVIFLFGITYHNFANLRTPHVWIAGIMYKALIRAVMEITLGAVLYKLSLWLQEFTYTGFAKIIFTVIEMTCFGGVIFYCFNHGPSKLDWYLVTALAIGVVIAASSISFSPLVFRSKVFAWLGEFSFSLYLGHGYWSHVLNNIAGIKDLQYNVKLIVYLIITCMTGLFIMYISKALRSMWKFHGRKILSIFIEVQ